MKKIIIVTLFLISHSGLSAAPGSAYIHRPSGQIIIGNDYFELTLDVKDGKFRAQHLRNKCSVDLYRLQGEIFGFTVTYPGLDITPPSDTPQRLTNLDLLYSGSEILSLKSGRELICRLQRDDITIHCHFRIPDDQPVMEQWLEITHSGGDLFLEKISPLLLQSAGWTAMYGGFGQPVFTEDLFFGVEFPAAYTISEGGRINGWYEVNRKLTKDQPYGTYPAVVGFAKPGEAQNSLFGFIRSRRPRPDKPFILYNSWYDIRDFSYEALYKTIHSFEEKLVKPYNLHLDAFVIDDGWDNVNSVWEIDSSRFPQGFTPLKEPLAAIGSKLGLWISPWNGYEEAARKRVDWAIANGYANSAGHLCLGDPKYFERFTKKALDHLKEGDLSFYKIDGFLSICNESGHDHLPGIASRVKLTEKFIAVLQKLREVKPDLFIDITVGTWLSPWWLFYADAVWMTGADYGHAEDVPAISERDQSITFRDYTLYKIFRDEQLQFPLSHIMTHGIIKGRLNYLGGMNESFRDWQNECVIYFGRGVKMWELYLSPDVLSQEDWDFLAAMMKWGLHNDAVLQNTRYIGGDPYRREIYGYFHEGRDESLLVLRNPFVAPADITLEAGKLFLNPADGEYVIEQIYPNHIFSREFLSASSPVNQSLQGYETRALRLIPRQSCRETWPLGVYLDQTEQQVPAQNYMLYLNPREEHCGDLINEKNIRALKLNNISLTPDEFRRFVCKQNKLNPKNDDANISFERLNSSGLSGSLEIRDEIENGRIGVLLEFSKAVDSLQADSGCAVIKGAEGRWYWILFPWNGPVARYYFNIRAANDELLPAGEISVYEMGEEKMKAIGKLEITTAQKPSPTESRIPVQNERFRFTRLIYKGELNVF
jgi:hypothetical protein